ncbi:MAG: DUF1786 domain-containing protein [Chloroflexi bacterium]|nr:DUF1786 domain-containing protein [Chloroflexota bacterium]
MDQSIRILAVDVGAGTQDILLYDSGQPMENCVKLVLPSQTVVVGRKILRALELGKDVFLTGDVMGGGACARAAKRHIEAGLKTYATERAARTFYDSLDRVRHMGVEITSRPPEDAVTIEMKDIDAEALRQALELFEVEMPPRFAVAVQDHGECVDGSNREFRFKHLREFAQAGGNIRDLAFVDPPAYLTRMRSVQGFLPGCVVMDTGPAAIWGALFDAEVAAHGDDGAIIVNVGNAHTFGALVQGKRIWGLFEHHTGDMTPAKLADYVRRLRLSALPHEEVLADGGHGAYVHPDFDPGRAFTFVSITGPNRGMAKELGYHAAAPFGDMMLTGCFGLVAASLEVERLPVVLR